MRGAALTQMPGQAETSRQGETEPTTMNDQEANRRPLRSRECRLWRSLAQRLARAGVSPNAISIVGLAAGIGAGGAFALTAAPDMPERLWWLVAAALIQLRLLCNLLDGLVAIEGGRGTPTGPLFNEMPDRVSDAATLIGLGFASQSHPWLGFGAAIAAILTAYVRAELQALGAGNDFGGPMAKPQRMFVATVASLLMIVIPKSWTVTFEALGIPALALLVIIVGCLATIAGRLRRGARALRRKASPTC